MNCLTRLCQGHVWLGRASFRRKLAFFLNRVAAAPECSKRNSEAAQRNIVIRLEAAAMRADEIRPSVSCWRAGCSRSSESNWSSSVSPSVSLRYPSPHTQIRQDGKHQQQHSASANSDHDAAILESREDVDISYIGQRTDSRIRRYQVQHDTSDK